MNVRLLVVSLLIISSCTKTEPNPQKIQGNVFGTSFHITYIHKREFILEKSIDSLFHLINNSLSTYQPSSDISLINKGDSTIVIDFYFKEVFEKSNRIFIETDGVFDPTIGILANAWGFGPSSTSDPIDATRVKELMKFVGFERVHLKDSKVIKQHPETYLDFNAIAKGYGVDVVGRFLESKGIENYMVEIGGELRVRGKNSENKLWRVGIEKPNFDGSRSLQAVVSLENMSMATSGNYRKFKIDSITGEKYVHTIDSKTGFTAKRNLLSASVISSLDCADVDGYATAFMAMGFESTLLFLEKHPELRAYLIYTDQKGNTKDYTSPNLSLQKLN